MDVYDAGVTYVNLIHAFVELPPSIDDDDTLKVSAAQAICEDMQTVTLYSNRPVTWKVKSYPSSEAQNQGLTLTSAADGLSCEVSGFKYAGTYTFEATDKETKSTSTTTINYGVQRLYDTATMPWVNNFTDPDVTYHVMSNDELISEHIGSVGLSANYKSNADNVVNGSIDDYMHVTGGLNVGSTDIICVKRSTPLDVTKKTRVGFVLMTKDTYLNVNLLSSMKVKAYLNGKECDTESRDHNFKVLDASIAGASDMKATEFNIELKAGQKVNEILLYTNAALKLDINDIRVYYAFSEAEDDVDNFETEQNNQGEIVSYKDGARIDEKRLGGFSSVASVLGNGSNYINFIDGNLTDSLAFTGIVNAGKNNVIPVKLGKIYSGKHLVEIKMGTNSTNLADLNIADVEAGNVFRIEAYLRDKLVASKTQWKAVDANVIKAGGDFTLRWTPDADFDEIVIHQIKALSVNLAEDMFYGMRIYSDADGDGIPDYEDDESCPNVAFLVDENEPSLNKIHDFTNSKMYLHRTFAAGKWTTICLPVDMTYNQFAATFGSDAKLAEPKPFRTDTPNRVQFDVDYVYGNNVLLHKNKPYIIKVNYLVNKKIDTKFAADNATSGTLAEEKSNNLTELRTYSPYTNAQEGSCYLLKGISYSTNKENDKSNIETLSFDHTSDAVWPMTQITWHGTFVCPQHIDADFYSFRLTPQDENADAEMDHVTDAIDYFRGLRCWMTANGTIAKATGAKQLALAVGDKVISSNTITGISDVTTRTQPTGNIYTLTGILVRRAATSTDGLNKGIYIWNNKKIEVK